MMLLIIILSLSMLQHSFRVVLGVALIVLLNGCGLSQEGTDEIDYNDDVRPLIATDEKPRVRGSCNVISSSSTCVDFIGSVFTEERMRLSCAEGTFSLDACPYSDLGGCQATAGTVSESIAWSYPYGGQPISAEEASYQARACNALSMGQWVHPDDLLNRE